MADAGNLKSTNPGSWHADFDEKGNCTFALYDDSYRKLLGYESEKEYANANETWESRIHPDDVEFVNKAYLDCISKHPEGLDYNVEYRMMTKWGYRWVHDYGHITRREDGSIKHCDGVVFDITDRVERETQNTKERQLFEEQKALFENSTRFFALEDNFESLYDVEIESGHYEVFVKGDFYKTNVAEKISSNNDFFRELRANIDMVVYPEERDELYQNLTREAIKKNLAEQDHYDYYYRLIYETGPVWFKMRIVYKDETKKNVIVGVFNATDEIEFEETKKENQKLKTIKKMQDQLNQTFTFTNFFLDTYVSAYYINLKTYSCQIYKRTEDLEVNYPIVTNYLDSLLQYIDNDVHTEDREALRELVQPETMIKKLKKDKEYSHIFRDVSNGIEKVYRMQIIRGEDSQHAAFGFIDITAEIQKQRAREIEAAESQKMIASISANFNIVYSVNLATDEFKLIRMDDNIIGKGEKFNSFSEAKEFFLNLLPELDQQKMSRELTYDVIRKNLKEKNSYSVEYRVPLKDAITWHEMKVNKIDDDLVVIAFANRDLEITKKHLENRSFNEYFALYEVDLDSGMMKVVKDSPYYEIEKPGTAKPFTPAMHKFAETLDGEARDFFDRLADIEIIKEDFSYEDKKTFAYRSNNVGDKLWVDCTCYVTLRKDDGTPVMFTLGFSLVDSLGVYRQELQGKYKEALVAADAANASKTSFLFNMSHDIRTPMNAIRGFTAMAKKHLADKDKVRDYLEKIDISGEQLLKLINQVLEMARIEAGKIEFEEAPFNVNNEYNSLVTVVGEQAKSVGLNFKHSIAKIEHANVLADGARISSVLMNLLGNSMKYTPEGGTIELKVSEVKCKRSGYATYKFVVSDTGIGMSKDYLEKLYEPFSREKSSTVSKIQGTGLGLSIVKNTVDLMGGKIEVESELNKGTKFTITVSLKIDDSSSEEVVEEVKPISFEGKKVLVVEDNEMNREIAKDILEEQGFVVDFAEDGDVAVKKVEKSFDKANYEKYDFVLMDVQMPKMNGYEATKVIREFEKKKGVHIPIIAMTANAFEEDRKNAIAAGMDDHLAKPIEVQKLFKTIARFMD